MDTSVKPEGTVSVAVTVVPFGAAVPAAPELDTVTVYVAACCPREKFPVCVEAMLRTATGVPDLLVIHPAAKSEAITAKTPKIGHSTLLLLERKSLDIVAILLGLWGCY
jgi:hypothetical protein